MPGKRWIVETSKIKSEAGEVWLPEDHAAPVKHLADLDRLAVDLVNSAKRQKSAAARARRAS